MSSDEAPPEQRTEPSSTGAGPYRRATLVEPSGPPRTRVSPHLVAATVVLTLVGLNTWRRAHRLIETTRVTPLREEPRGPRFAPLEGVTRLAWVGSGLYAKTATGEIYVWMRGAAFRDQRVTAHPAVYGQCSVAVLAVRDSLLDRSFGSRSEVVSIGSARDGLEGVPRYHRYRLEADGRVRLVAYDGQPDGPPTRLSERFVSGLPRAVELVDGPCVRSLGQVWCWRDRPFDGPRRDPVHLDDLTPPMRVEGDFEALSLSAHPESDHYASSTRGEVWRWSRYDTEYGGRFVAARVAGFHDVTRVFAVGNGVCGLHSNGSVSCAETRTSLRESGPLPPLQRVRSIDGVRDLTDVIGDGHQVCGINPARRVVCWGGSTGTGALAYRARPAPVPGLREVVGLAAGDAHACALGRDGRVRCWGQHLQPSFTLEAFEAGATLVDGLAEVAQISASENDNCAVRRDGAVLCWGAFPPSRVALPGAASEVMVRRHAACARLRDATVWCWPLTTIPDGGTPAAPRRVGVPPARGFLAYADRTCARDAVGAVRCWRFPWRPSVDPAFSDRPWSEGETLSMAMVDEVTPGNGGPHWTGTPGSLPEALDHRWLVPRSSGGLDGDVAALASNDAQTCAVLRSGVVRCQGGAVPDGMPGVRELAFGGRFGCALHHDGTVSCWGDNIFGQLGVQGLHHAPPAEVVVARD